MLPLNETDLKQLRDRVFGSSFDGYTGPAIDAYIEHYNDVVRPYAASPANAVINVGTPALRTHSDLLECATVLQQSAGSTFNQFIANCRPLRQITEGREKEYTVNTLINVLFMVDCGLRNYHSRKFQKTNLSSAKWEGDVQFHEFLEETFLSQGIGSSKVQARVTSLPMQGSDATRNQKALKAWKLIGRYGLQFKPTNNLLEHLAYNPTTRCLKVFHQVSFLRAQLQRTNEPILALGFRESLEKGALPPKLILETLLTIHHILFPIVEDSRSDDLLNKLIKRKGFDPENQYVDFVRLDYDQPDMIYEYWGERLETLYNLVEDPPPANVLVAWFERHTSERNALTVAIIGLFLAVVFGFLSVVIGILQLVVAWLAWKYP